MHAVELEIKDTIETDTSAPYLDFFPSIEREGQLRTCILEKRDDTMQNNKPAYGVFISQYIRYARACTSYGCFTLRTMPLSNQILEH